MGSSYCKHNWYFITSGKSIGAQTSQHEVHVCKKCGQFEVWGRENGQLYRVSFVLTTRDGVESAGKYREMLESEFPDLIDESKG